MGLTISTIDIWKSALIICEDDGRKFLWAKLLLSFLFNSERKTLLTLSVVQKFSFQNRARSNAHCCGIMHGTSNDVMMDQKNQSKINSTNMQVLLTVLDIFSQKSHWMHIQ